MIEINVKKEFGLYFVFVTNDPKHLTTISGGTYCANANQVTSKIVDLTKNITCQDYKVCYSK
jgi:hypothetical protein